MKALFYNLVFASVYGSGAYNSSTYNGTGSGASSGASGSLSNTGLAIAVIATIAAVLLLTAMVIRIWKRPSKKSQPQPIEQSEN